MSAERLGPPGDGGPAAVTLSIPVRAPARTPGAPAPRVESRRGMGTLESFNPATGELVGTVDTITPEQAQEVVDDVAEVQPFWAQLSLAARRM